MTGWVVRMCWRAKQGLPVGVGLDGTIAEPVGIMDSCYRTQEIVFILAMTVNLFMVMGSTVTGAYLVEAGHFSKQAIGNLDVFSCAFAILAAILYRQLIKRFHICIFLLIAVAASACGTLLYLFYS